MRSIEAVVRSFILAKKANGRAPRTIQDYHRCLEPFAEWCKDQGLDTETLDRNVFRYYVAKELRADGLADSTVAIHIRNLRCFLRWIYEEGYTKDNVAVAIESPPVYTRDEEPLTPEEIRTLVGACCDDPYATRDRAIILVFWDTGVRLGEMANLQRSDVHFEEDGTANIRVYSSKVQKHRYAFLGKKATAALKEYMEELEDAAEALWMGRVGPLTKRGIYGALKRRARLVGLGDRVHPHLFRKTFTTDWLDGSGDPERLRVLAGWTTLKMLKVYASSAKKRLERAHRQAGPVDRLL